jgi:uncharacterized 2Fe-2S/4Fe-4S cluster protein (DUF4445 family)
VTTAFQVQLHLPGESRPLRVEADQLQLSIAEILYSHGVLLNTRCGRQGICDGCEVELLGGMVTDLDSGCPLTAGTAPVRFRACRSQFVPAGGVAIRVPLRSLAVHAPVATAEFRIRIPFSHQPLFDGQLAASIDVGTTSVTVAVFDLADGAILATMSAPNAQSHWGQDVLSRIACCQRDPRAVAALQEAVCTKTIVPLIEQCLDECGAGSRGLAGATVAGNAVMLHLLAGEDPTPLGRAPFETVFTCHRLLEAGAIGLAGPGLAGDRPIHLLPSASAYVGADVVAGAIATGLAYGEGPSMLLDLGTNGEIILKHGRQTLACATAAGPAFEGMGLTCGMTASRGAISRARVEAATASIETDVIGGEAPRGICGSAYIDLLAEGRRMGLLDCLGRFQFDDAAALRPLQGYFNGEMTIRVSGDVEQKPIVLTEGDIAALLQAKAAVAAGALTLLARSGIDAGDVRAAFVAGAFGTQLDAEHAVDIGLLPAGFRGRVEAVGNTSLAGAYTVALDRQILDDAERYANEVEVVELNFDNLFEARFVDQLLLP